MQKPGRQEAPWQKCVVHAIGKKRNRRVTATRIRKGGTILLRQVHSPANSQTWIIYKPWKVLPRQALLEKVRLPLITRKLYRQRRSQPGKQAIPTPSWQ